MGNAPPVDAQRQAMIAVEGLTFELVGGAAAPGQRTASVIRHSVAPRCGGNRPDVSLHLGVSTP